MAMADTLQQTPTLRLVKLVITLGTLGKSLSVVNRVEEQGRDRDRKEKKAWGQRERGKGWTGNQKPAG